jgi:hypothetical protein
MVDLILSQLTPQGPQNSAEIERISVAWNDWSARQLRGLCSELVILLVDMGVAWQKETGSLEGALNCVRRPPPTDTAPPRSTGRRRWAGTRR